MMRWLGRMFGRTFPPDPKYVAISDATDKSNSAKLDTKTCKYCAMTIPSQAKICPYCRKQLGWTMPAKIALGIIVVIIIGNIISPKNDSSAVKAGTPGETVYNSSWDGSVYQVKAYLDKTLKDPKSFEAIEWSPVEKYSTEAYKYAVRCRYRAKNSFGGYVIANQFFYLDSSGRVIDVIDDK